ncbi:MULTISPECIES: hypothetical protein [unclassified Streptomyces]|uniref:hypothetical protein n=1 Tax=unclassified Streptomyces TaxID=2593676 RepID=UPI002DDBA661|nr:MULTISPECIES: hypothetical protein [unclassified Streptomyces]WSA91038.1 hypothetical protein OIE63_05400 [Streptomyces sp. NBC_01795]WSB75363.1 hypothetical protein OHB04_05940 [Streptomyces sp. NBC_01775]WSS16355.1 hypothetical protein OG533_33970 [Streptomyces sp. NBC_01186]WSS45172.1 hypothetical protein OG220_34645 [Streptomyces sp. NBC_01187]
MTTQGAAQPLQAGPVDDDLDWDHPLTRLILLLEIADQPDWLRDFVSADPTAPSAGPASARHRLG